MDKNYRLFGIGLTVCGIAGYCLLLAKALMGDAFPNPLRFIGAVCLAMHAIGLLVNLFYIINKAKKTDKENSQSV